uniref:Epidermal growth factor receptor pathway substrate 15 n=1 Tax=Oncorhynchus kisutch TaxID=8019 RepID=A0A8C7I8G0_ONCKI
MIIKCVSRSILCLSPQLSSGNPLYDKYYRQVDPSGSGRVAAADAALFLKRSGLADLVLGKIWDLADSDRKGCLNDQQFFIALRLVACAQNGLEVALKSLNLAVPPPKFHDTSSPLLPGGVSIDSPWVVKTEEKLKFDAIFESLSPVGGMLSGEKVKPVLLNSKLPVDVLGRVWELSDLDRDGMLDRDEFAVVMYLVYRALEGEPIPMSLPATLVPPSKRKKLPVSVPPYESEAERLTPISNNPVPSVSFQWAVSPPDKAKYDEVFAKTDLDMDGLVSGPEVRDIFLKTGLPSATLARIWELCDIGDIGKLTREQFALALHLINQKLTMGVDPPQNLCPEMIPPSDRLSVAAKQVRLLSIVLEKSSVEQDINEKEERVRERTSEVQELQNEVQKESGVLQRLQSQRQEVQDALEELDQQKTTLEEQLGHIRQQCSHENQLISSLEVEHAEQEQRIEEYEEQLVQAREELLRLQEETQHLEEKVQAAREQLTPLQESVRDSFSQVSQVSLLRLTIITTTVVAWCKDLMVVRQSKINDFIVIGQVESPEPEGRPESTEPPQATPPALPPQTTPPPLPAQPTMSPTTSPPPLPGMDFFQSDPFIDHDPFKDDPFGKADVSYPFGGDPFKGTDPFAADSFFKQSLAAPFPSADSFTLADPFSGSASLAEPNLFAAPLNNAAGMDPFSSKPQNKAARDPFSAKVNNVDADQFGSKIDSLAEPDLQPSSPDVPPALPPKTGTPTRPPPPPPGQCSDGAVLCLCVCFCVFLCGVKQQYPTEEDMIEWATRESEREEKVRLARQAQQEQEDLELAIALSKSEFS